MATPSFKDARKQRLEKIKADREKVKSERNKANTPTNTTTPDNTPEDQKPKGFARFAPLINDKAVILYETALPFIINFAIEKIGIDPNKALDELLCPANPDDLIVKGQFFNELNNFIDNINQISDTIDSFKSVINASTPIINSIETGIAITSTAQLALSVALKALPPGALAFVPAAIVALPDDLDYFKSLALFTNDGTPRIPVLKGGIGAINAALTLVQSPLSSIVDNVEKIKSYFSKCLSPQDNPFSELNDFNPSVTGLIQNFNNAQQNNNDYYNGFLIEIEEKDFSPTVKQRRAVGKNKDGIILIQTPYSFTTANQTLFNELKFIIDRDNLKAY